ncbi:uncharacterized protein LOC132292695 [Cornus florida]|uniref:uncharacterized protein LOC132292695 n=1 Tax=Cornus florida TaxID=4283 RepID=UPI00289A2D82|nr:uncharacterized protein LOC132292695 [Cornus florida]
MGRGRGKGKKQAVVAAHEDTGSGEEEKIPTYRRRGRPQKPLKDEIKEEEAEKIEEEEEDGENTKSSTSNEDLKNQGAMENGSKRKRSSHVKENPDSVKEENGVGTKTGANDSARSVGFRQNGSRRKNKPRRAAEVGVGCK